MNIIKKLDKLKYKELRKDAAKDQYNNCCYCFAPMKPDNLTADHRIPKSKGGKDTKENIAAACVHCNSVKSSMSEAAFRKLIKNPQGKSLQIFLIWSRRKIWLRVHRTCKGILASVGQEYQVDKIKMEKMICT